MYRLVDLSHPSLDLISFKGFMISEFVIAIFAFSF
jgi:hypothetical protein